MDFKFLYIYIYKTLYIYIYIYTNALFENFCPSTPPPPRPLSVKDYLFLDPFSIFSCACSRSFKVFSFSMTDLKKMKQS